MSKRRATQLPTAQPPAKPLSASDACYLGAAEAMKFGALPESRSVTRAQLKAARTALSLFEDFTDDEMALSLLLAMVTLGRRVERREAEAKEKNT